MAEGAQARVQGAVTKVVDELDRNHMRKLQGDMHRCAAACCDRQEYSVEHVNRCVEDCSKGVASAQNYVRYELNNFQERLHRGTLQCQDRIRDKILPSTTEAEVDSFRAEFERCVVRCADDHVALLPKLLKKMKDTMDTGKYPAHV